MCNICEDIENEYQSNVDSIHTEFNNKSKYIEPFYHYTNENGLRGILTSQELWFTDYRYLNDPSEYLLSLKIVKDLMAEHIRLETDTKKIVFWNYFKNKFEDHLKYYQVFTFSFCLSKDYLPAWRWYGDNGKGFSIGFNQDFFDPATSALHPDWNKVWSIRVNYNKDNIAELLYKFITAAEEIYNKYINSIGTSKCMDITLLAIISSNLMSLMPGFKHFGYEYEREHRFYESELIVNGHSYPDKISDERKRIESYPNKLRSPKFDPNDICEIWIGPSNEDPHKAEKMILNILKSSGYDHKKIKISKSEMPYR